MCSSRLQSVSASSGGPCFAPFAKGGSLRILGVISAICLALLATLLLPSQSTARTQTPTTTAKPTKTRRPHHALRHAHTRALIAAAVARGEAIPTAAAAATFDPPEQSVGERLFLETRFAQFFAAHYDGNVNHVLPAGHGDPTVTYVQTTTITDKILGPFAGTSVNCRSCHFVDDAATTVNRGPANVLRPDQCAPRLHTIL